MTISFLLLASVPASAARGLQYELPPEVPERVGPDTPALEAIRARCGVDPVPARLRGYLTGVTERFRATLRDPRFQQLIREKRDWSATGERALWRRCQDTPGACALRYLNETPRRITVLALQQQATRRCIKQHPGERANAFAPLRWGLLVFSSDYLESRRQRRAEGEVIRTLAHETLHTAGFSHDGLRPGGRAYNNTVPVYVACAAQHWPDVDWIRANCGKATSEQAPRR